MPRRVSANCVDCGGPKAPWRHRLTQRCEQCAASFGVAMRAAGASVKKAERLGMPKATAFACTDCGLPATDYDHRDYAKPLEVEPVCRKCNFKRGPALWGVHFNRPAEPEARTRSPS